MVRLRVLNDRGVEAFRSFLEDSAEGGGGAPTHLLYDDAYSSTSSHAVFLDEDEEFTSKLELGRYLSQQFSDAGVDRQEVSTDLNLWASVVLLWFDQFCPVLEDGTRGRIPQERADGFERFPKFIPRIVARAGESSLRGRRHYALGPYLIFDYNKDTEHQADAILSGPINAWGDDVEQTAGRIEVISNRNLIAVIRMLYWDEANGRLKPGYSTKARPGNINRLLADLRNQIKLTKDWYSMAPQEIYDSLPPEYDEWKTA